MTKELTIIVGPTGSGKTALGVEAARLLNGAVVSGDSRQIYEGMSIGTGKPKFSTINLGREKPSGQFSIFNFSRRGRDPAAAGQFPKITTNDPLDPNLVEDVEHYLFDIRTPDVQLTLAEWQGYAFGAIEKVVAEGKAPLLVGGSMLYVDSVAYNYAIPEVEPNEKLRNELETRETSELYAALVAKDPAAAEFVQAENKRRIIRALEVMEGTGQLWSQTRRKRESKYKIRWIGLFTGWETLRERIKTRTDEMWSEGLLRETAELRKRYGSIPILETMNYKQAGMVLDGKLSEEEAKEEMVRVMMRYARRQMSWWRRNDEIEWFESTDVALMRIR